ncbi:HAMP domain-containing sensor histidine kinase [Sphingobacterium sp. DR205]|uniref:sensor histidine kinase n=1 Tax=Sphingobacterium sp. DR205 TaxID=2713573 RepID=UPI0013E428B0|nr:HAMP domain-containing sensor histidine kinase [Sphingobacterium sp. DR205]QIH31686.1 HAMP domain-containing histidine kinase [Sphingobacterium sp. DR205]
MKLANQTLKYLSISVLVVIAVWSTIFYLFMLEVIHDNIDEELENQKRLIIQELASEAIVSPDLEFGVNNYKVREISEQQAINMQNVYKDTMLYMQDDDDPEPELEPVRMLTTAFEHKGHYYELAIINSMIEESDLIKNLFYSVLILFVLLVVSIVSINKVVIERLWSPLYHFLDQLTKFRLGKSDDKPAMDTEIMEFKDLQFAVTTLIQHNEEIYEQQKQFIGNASHELQTPLAIMINKLEMVAETEGLQPEQANAIAEVLNTAERLVRLNKSLLLLTKIENRQFLNNEDLSLNTLVTHIVEELEDMAAFKNITIQVLQQLELNLQLDSSLANIMVSNLIRNALFHNIEGGEVTITITENALLVANTSVQGPLDVEQVFSRFYKSDASSKGTGLGLAIVQAICHLYGFEISYDYDNSRHIFKLNFHPA